MCASYQSVNRNESHVEIDTPSTIRKSPQASCEELLDVIRNKYKIL